MLQNVQRLALARAFRRRGSKGWLAAGTAVWLLRAANRARKPDAVTIYRTELAPGEQIVIDHRAVDQAGRPATRRAKKAHKKARRAARQQARAARR